ncbi:type IV secretory system conjugative DNA transfer family protein [Sulfitobacter pacificus]|uniref:type IV secretory system conjugative DNA transfer family protein n=1 Tax=Sulfitobacter pacificus TaxID=1499314 RepID=UPI00333ECA01
MSFPFGWMNIGKRCKPRPFAKAKPAAIDPKGRRFLGFTMESHQPVWALPGHSLTLAANGSGKTTNGLMPWLFSLLASSDRPAILVMDSKDGEIAAQCVPMLKELGVPTAVIDDTYVLPRDVHGRVRLNAMQSVVQTYLAHPEDQVFANDTVTLTAIEEPENDHRNRYFRAWPRLLIEFVIYLLLKRDPAMATPGAVWALLSNPDQLRRFAEIEAVEGDGMLKSHAVNIIGMAKHEHWPQHLQAACDAMRIFAVGTRLHLAGHKADTTHGDLIKKRAVVFLCGSQANMGSMGIYYGLHLMSFIRAAYLRAGPLWIGADEFTNAPVKKLVEALTTLRAYGVTVSMIAQSRSEIERKLGKHETLTIEDNSIIKQWLGLSSFEEAERVSKAMGEEHVVSAGISGGNDDLSLQTNLNLTKQPFQTPAELMAMPRGMQLVHGKGFGFRLLYTGGQQNIAPYCDLIADNPLEGGRLPSDPKITFTLPEETRS